MASIHKLNTIDPTGQRAFPQQALETRVIVKLLSAKAEGTTVTYAELEAETGRPCSPGSTGYRYLRSARRILLRDFAIVVDAEANVGVRICTNEEKMLVSGRDAKRARRAVHASKQKLGAVTYEALDAKQKTEFNARMSILGAIDLMSAPKALKLVEGAVTDHALPSAKTLELFRK